MSNIDTIDSVIAQLEEIDGATGAIFASVAWGYAFSLANNHALDLRIDLPDDPRFGRLSDEQKRERRSQLEAQRARTEEVLAWAASHANPDFLPEGETVVQRLLESAPAERTGDEMGALIKEAMRLTDEEYAAYVERDAKRRGEEHAAQVAAASDPLVQKGIAQAIDQALRAPVGPDFELDDRDAIRVLERIAEKCERYEQARVERAFRTRRARVIKQLAAERLLLNAVMDRSDELAVRLTDELEAQGPASEAVSSGRSAQQMVEDERAVRMAG